MKVTHRSISNLFFEKPFNNYQIACTTGNTFPSTSTCDTHTEFGKMKRSIVLIELKICFYKALRLIVTVTVSIKMINVQLILISMDGYQVKRM